MKLFSSKYLSDLTCQAKTGARLRQYRNVHQSFQEPCQRLFNAIEPGSYIRPHRHTSDPRDEMLVAIRGLMALIVFNEEGKVLDVVRFGTERYGEVVCAAVEISPAVWHTVISLETGSVLLEIKAGPFDPGQPKDLAPWAPEEGSVEAPDYLGILEKHITAAEPTNAPSPQ
jgi:cupin fold WbuC family metalloprotein